MDITQPIGIPATPLVPRMLSGKHRMDNEADGSGSLQLYTAPIKDESLFFGAPTINLVE